MQERHCTVTQNTFIFGGTCLHPHPKTPNEHKHFVAIEMSLTLQWNSIFVFLEVKIPRHPLNKITLLERLFY